MSLQKKDGETINLRYKKILRSMVFGNFTAALHESVNDGNPDGELPKNLPFCG